MLLPRLARGPVPATLLPRLARGLVVPAALLLVAPSFAAAQRTPLSIERLTTGPSLTGTSPAAPQWSPDSRTLAFSWNPPGAAGRTLWLVDRDGTTPRRALPADNTTPVGGFFWAPRGDAILFVQRGEVWRLTVPGGVVTPVTTDGGERSELQLSPDGTSLSFLRAGDLWVQPVAGGAARRLTRIGQPPIGVIPLGTYYGNDVEIGRGTWGGAAPSHAWSPDSRTIAVHYVDRRGVPTFSMPYYLGDTAQMNVLRRGAPGQANEVRMIGMVSVESGALSFVPLPDSSSTRVVNYEWSPSGALMIDRETDDAINRTIHIVAPGSAPSRVWQDRRDTRIYNDIHSTWSADGRTLLITGDLDDRYRLYRITPGDSVPRLLTPGPQDVAGAGVPRAPSRSIDYVSTAPRPSERHVFRVDERTGRTRQLTSRAGMHAPTVSPDGRTIALISSSDTMPPELFLLDTRVGATERRITVSQPAEFATVPWVAGTYITFPGTPGNPPLHARLLLPPNLDSTKQYPVLIGPAYSNTVRNRWAGLYGMVQQYLAIEKGYIVVQVDVRGSTGYGRDFREAFLMDWGGGDLEDLERTVQHLKTLPFVAPDRFGIWGSSYGGTLTIYSLLKKPGLFQAGVAGAAAVDPFLFGSDDVAIVRRPQSHPATFERGALQYAGNLRDHLLLIHGLQDDVVPVNTVIKLAEEFMRLGKDFDMAVAPAATHGWTQRPYYARYLLTKLVQHFDRHLGPGPRAPGSSR
jgi:dipeptidyl-peptidase 4